MKVGYASGSKLIVWFSPERYIDVRTDVRRPGHSYLEYVEAGQVKNRRDMCDAKAPAAIREWMRQLK